MLCGEVQNYISTAKGLPFLYIVGDENYNNALNELKQAGLSVVRVSDFCNKDDKFPSVDDLIYHFQTLDVDYRDNKFVVVGLGEYLALRGATFAEKEFRRIKNTTLGNARVIILTRGIDQIALKIIGEDKRINEQQRTFVDNDTLTSISIINVSSDINPDSSKGIKLLLQSLEDGGKGTIYSSTSLLLDNCLLPVRSISNSFDLIRDRYKEDTLKSQWGNEEQWNCLLKELGTISINEVFKKHQIDETVIDNLYEEISGEEYRNWLVFLYLKRSSSDLKNEYLKYMVLKTDSFDRLKENIIVGITEYTHNDSCFMSLYNDRKKLVRFYPEEDILLFIKANKADSLESIYRFTDNTEIEKKEIVKWIANNGISEAVEYVYPALNEYLNKYIFECANCSKELTEYFDLYKKQKVTNRIADGFEELVNKYAADFLYTKLPTRDNAVKAIQDKDTAFLYWIDALGVEYMSYITALAKKKGLSVHTVITRADLPTITSVNKGFFEQWVSGMKYKEEELDNTKHKEKGGYFFTDDEDPIYIPKELDIIEGAINKAKMELVNKKCKSFVIVGDHGASRLAVLKKQEVPYDTDTKGEHSGRCCKAFEGCNIDNVIEENGFLVLTDYGRFRGSRQANVEVHGGASLEEILVPVITLTLKKQTSVQIKVQNADNITVDRRNGVCISLYISDIIATDNVSIAIGDKKYQGTADDSTHFSFIVKDIKRARSTPYSADVYDGEDLIGNIEFVVKGKTATVNDDFDFGDDF